MGGKVRPLFAKKESHMKESDCTMDTPVALANKDKVRRGKIVGPVSQAKGKTLALVEWSDGRIEKVAVTSLLTEDEADVIAAELKAKSDAKNAEANRKREKREALERDFEAVFDKFHPQIQAKMQQAAALIGEAEKLSEQSGIPFRPKFGTPFQMSYIPKSLKKKWAELQQDDEGYEFVGEFTGAYGGEYDGWQSSQVC